MGKHEKAPVRRVTVKRVAINRPAINKGCFWLVRKIGHVISLALAGLTGIWAFEYVMSPARGENLHFLFSMLGM